jgi:putative transcriptional regulator
MKFPLKELRLERGWSQVKLAQECQVSLPTIQNIEAEKANPTLDIISKILSSLGLDIRIEPKEFNVGLAIDLGVPLSDIPNEGILLTQSVQTPDNLAKEASYWIQLFKFKKFQPREEEAVVSLLMAVKDHYPKYYQQRLQCDLFEQKIQEHRKNGKCIKLRRLSLAEISQYL